MNRAVLALSALLLSNTGVTVRAVPPPPPDDVRIVRLLQPGTWVTLAIRSKATDGDEQAEIIPYGTQVPINLRLVQDGMASMDHTPSRSLSGKITGDQCARHIIAGKSGHKLSVEISATNSRTFFPISPPGSGKDHFLGEDADTL